MKKTVIVLAILIYCAGCSPSPKAIQRALSETQTAMPTYTSTPTPTFTPTATFTPAPTFTPTPIPLSEIDLEAILIQTGDLPAGYVPAQIHKVTNDQLLWVNNHGVNNIYQEIAKNDETAGGITILVYNSVEEVIIAYDELVAGLGENGPNELGMTVIEALEGVGEIATYSTNELSNDGFFLSNTSIVFIRCNAVVSLGLMFTSNVSQVSGFAQRLDERLIPLVCK